ncbi:MAG: 6-hydroxymethylpterin diphosphokinase MptE-like protein [Halobacteriaceae archaeon]
MEFTDWEPAYESILADFGYDREADELARDVLADLTRPFDVGRIDVAGDAVAVAGGAATLGDELDRVREADSVFAASNAAATLREAGVSVDAVVTDLDKVPATARELSREGTPVAVHAHGDNVPAVEEHVPTFDRDWVLPTTQAAPRGPVRNFGGFTDGDRAAFLADHLGAGRLLFPGWDLDDDSVSDAKRHKLRWAARLLRWLERRRGQRFGLLDGRRADLDLPWLGVP